MFSNTLKPEIMQTMLPKGFPADKLSQPLYEVIVEKDVVIAMRDGTRLSANIFRPYAPGKFPGIAVADAYQKDLYDYPSIPIFHFRETNDLRWFASRGYVMVHTDLRGTGHSVEGEWQLFSQVEQNDLYDLVEWIAMQPWCTGKVGMHGESLLAWSQWFAAAQQPPHLVCIQPWDGGADLYRDVAFHGGMMAMGFPTAWHFWEIRGHYRLSVKGPNPDMGRWDIVWNFMNHPTYDEFWRVRTPDYSKITVPVFSICSWLFVGLHLRGSIRGYEEVNTPKKLMCVHGILDGDEIAIYNSPEMQLLILRWFDHWLKGNDTGFMEEPPVNIFVRGAETYRTEAAWPLPDTQYRKLYLHPGPSGVVESLNDGRLSWEPPAADADGSTGDGQGSFVFNYPDVDWTHFIGGGTAVVLEDGSIHPTKRIATFISDPFEEDLEVTGCPVLVLFASSDQTDTDFFCRVVDEAPDSDQEPGRPPKGRILTRGWLKASHACTLDKDVSKPYRPYYRHDFPEPIEPGKIDKYLIEVWPTSNVFKKGHRLRLDIAPGDSCAADFGGHYYGLKMGTDTYYYDKQHPSHIVLPVIAR